MLVSDGRACFLETEDVWTSKWNLSQAKSSQIECEGKYPSQIFHEDGKL